MKTYKIHLIRHAMTKGNLEGKYVGQVDMPACSAGLKQVQQMVRDYDYPEVEAIVSSPLKRCIQTAKVIYPNKTPLIIDALKEYNFGEFEGRTADEMKEDEAFIEWLAGTNPKNPVPFGESQAEFAKRVCTAFTGLVDGIVKAGIENTAVFTHGGVIMALMTKFAIPEAPMQEWMTPNGCGYTLRIDPMIWSRGKKLEAFAECPPVPMSEDEEYAKWDYYKDDDFDISEYVNEDTEK
ncbi:MAG: histidine phosphatase family protein [Oscillospiraceae bacterium]